MSLLLPRTKSLEQLNNLVPFALPHIIDTNRAHLDIIIEQKVEQTQQPIQLVIIRPLWEIATGNRGAPQTFD